MRRSDEVRIPDAKLLVAAVRELALARKLTDVQSIVRRAARALMNADGATFVLREGDECFYADEEAITPLWKGRRFPMSECVCGWVMLNRTSVVIEDIYADERVPAEAYRPTFVQSLAIVPIRQPDPIGAIGIYWASKHKPSQAEIELLEALADSTSIAMERLMLDRAHFTTGNKPTSLAAKRCRNLYAFIRHRLGQEVSDREIARRWSMSWRSFVNLKEGSRRVPRVEELEALAELLGVDPMITFLVSRGEPADVVNRWLLDGDDALRSALLTRIRLGGTGADTGLRLSLERIPCAVLTVDLKGRIGDLNSRLLSLLAADLRDIVGTSFFDFVSTESAAILLRLQAQSLDRGESGPEELLLVNGTLVAISMVRIETHEQKPIGFQCMAQDTAAFIRRPP